MALERPQSGWLDFLDWVRAPGRAVMNLDRPEYARGYAADFLAGPLDAVVPGDLIDSQVPEDTREYNPWIEAAANPITYAGLLPGVRRAVPALAKQGGQKLYDLAPKSVQAGLDKTRRTLAWDDYGTELALPERTAQFDPAGYVPPMVQKIDKDGNLVFSKIQRTRPEPAGAPGEFRSVPEVDAAGNMVFEPEMVPVPAPPTKIAARKLDPNALLNKATGVELTSAQSQIQDLLGKVQKLGGITQDEDRALADVIDNLDWSAGKHPAVLDSTHNATNLDYTGLTAAAKKRLDMWVSKNPAAKIDKRRAYALIDEHYAITDKQIKEAVSRGAIGAERRQQDYLSRMYEGVEGGAAANKPREYESAEELANWLKVNPRVDLERSWQKRMVHRARGQGKLLKRAYLRSELTDPALAKFLLQKNEPGASAAVKEAHRVFDEGLQAAVPDSDLWARLKYELNGDVPQNAIENSMRSLNTVFKPAAVYGVGPFVRVGSIVRNQLTAYWQLAGSPEGRAYLMSNPAHGIKNLIGAFDDALSKNLFNTRLDGTEITQSIDAIEGALKGSQGMTDQTIANLRVMGRNTEADALEHGILNGFVLSEDLAQSLMTLKDRVNPVDWMIPGHSAIADIGGKAFGGLEQRMRFGFFKDLVENQKKSAAEAAQMVNDRFLDYAVTSAGNRSLRTYFPFAQFIVKTMPQQAKMLSATPALLPAIGALYGGDDLPGYAREQAHVGNVLPGVAPTDVFNMIPDFTGSSSFEAFQHSAAKTAGALHPILGAGIGLASGRDTFTGKPYLEDARLPLRDPKTTERNALDTAWGLGEDVGLLQPVAGPFQQAKSLGKMENPALAALRYATGINTLPVDPLRAEADKLSASLAGDPRVKSYDRMYTKSEDEQLNAALKRLDEVRKELAAKVQPGILPAASSL